MQIPMRWHPYRLRDLWHCDIPRKRFPKLFQKLKSGGLYIIEDLRWLPSVMEKEGITKTALLFGGFSKLQQFLHVDKEVEAEINALAPTFQDALCSKPSSIKKSETK